MTGLPSGAGGNFAKFVIGSNSYTVDSLDLADNRRNDASFSAVLCNTVPEPTPPALVGLALAALALQRTRRTR